MSVTLRPTSVKGGFLAPCSARKRLEGRLLMDKDKKGNRSRSTEYFKWSLTGANALESCQGGSPVNEQQKGLMRGSIDQTS